ncbi:uncharacterized protein LOC135499197 [Lineus longissimus]|uniref:uncharacterized protein LOC135499197 n=1 Tax=Lineus longissimus TaxID=88925 RepID=UPI00315D42D0
MASMFSEINWSSDEYNEFDELDSAELDENQQVADLGISPYQYEPETDESGEESADESEMDQDEHDEPPLELDNWCSCGKCQILPSRTECVCCREAIRVKDMVDVGCVTDRTDFDAICLHTGVLNVAWLAYKQQYGRNAYEGSEHKKLRHIAYRQFVRWSHGYLGKDIRVVVPACVVCKIRAFYPPPGIEENMNFEGFHHVDE